MKWLRWFKIKKVGVWNASNVNWNRRYKKPRIWKEYKPWDTEYKPEGREYKPEGGEYLNTK